MMPAAAKCKVSAQRHLASTTTYQLVGGRHVVFEQQHMNFSQLVRYGAAKPRDRPAPVPVLLYKYKTYDGCELDKEENERES
eukprot:1179979-Prorocentrum_minimum.AAC.1